MEGADPDHKSSEHWKEKYDKAISALENCEQSKKSLEKQHEELRRRDEDKRILCEKLTTEITILVEKCKLNEEVRGRLKDSKDELIQRMSKVENELSAEKGQATQYEGRLEEKDATIKQLIEETVYLKEVNEKTVSKSKALEQLGIELNTAKEHLESKILLYETRIVEKDTEIEQLEKKLQFQSAVFEELQMTVVNMTGELSNLKGVLEENHQKKVKISQSLIDMRKSFTSKNEHLAEECYSQALELAKAYNDCDEYCRKIEELESALAGAQKESNIGMDISQEMLISREEDLKQVTNYNRNAKNKVAELEDQISNYRQEIQNLRSLITTERSTRLELEEQFDKRDAECKLLLKKMNMHEDEVQSLTNELDAKNQWNEMTGKSETERKQEAGSLGGVEEMRKQQTGGVKSVEVAGEDNKVKSELFKLRNECLVLAKRNEELKAENGWWSSIYEEAKADVEKLKQHVLMLQDNSTDIGPDGESISKIRIHYGVLKEERTKLKKAVDDLKLERYKLKNEIEDTKKSLWELKQEKEVSISMIDELEKKTMECTLERESMMKKGNHMFIPSISNHLISLITQQKSFRMIIEIGYLQ